MLRFVIVATALLFAGQAAAQVQVRGYTRADGTYVAPHVRSSPNSTTADNWGSSRSSSYGSSRSSSYGSSYSSPQPLYGSGSSNSSSSSSSCTGYGCYAQPSSANGRARTETVNGYIRRDGTYVAPYVRSPQ